MKDSRALRETSNWYLFVRYAWYFKKLAFHPCFEFLLNLDKMERRLMLIDTFFSLLQYFKGLQFEHIIFVKKTFSISAYYTQLIGHVATNRQIKSANTIAHLIHFLNRRCQVNPPKNPQTLNYYSIHPANLIAYSRNKPRFRQYHWLCECSHLEQVKRIEGVKSPINLAVTSGNGNKEFNRKTICSNLK